MVSILFVCHGNICRSPMAEFVMRDLVTKRHLGGQIYVESAATSTEEIGNDMHYGTKKKLREMGVPFTKRSACQMTSRDYDRFDLIVAMDSFNLYNMKRFVGKDPQKKVYLLLDFSERKGQDIADPWYTGDFDATYNDILEGCTGLLAYIIDRGLMV